MTKLHTEVKEISTSGGCFGYWVWWLTHLRRWNQKDLQLEAGQAIDTYIHRMIDIHTHRMIDTGTYTG